MSAARSVTRSRFTAGLPVWLPILSGGGILLLVVLLAVSAPLLFPGDPLDMVAAPFEPPGTDMSVPLGSDSMGRDLASGLAYGARVSMAVGVTSTVIGILSGIAVGGIGGYVGGRTDALLVRLTEIFQTFPPFLLVVVLVAIAGPSVTSITLSIGLVSWPQVARIVRAEFRALKNLDFVVAARAAGYSEVQIAVGHVLPNALGPIIATSSVMVASAILIESALSFLSLGDPNLVSWGSIIGTGRDQIRSAWYVVTLPGVAIVITVLGLNLLADGLGRLLDPRRRR